MDYTCNGNYSGNRAGKGYAIMWLMDAYTHLNSSSRLIRPLVHQLLHPENKFLSPDFTIATEGLIRVKPLTKLILVELGSIILGRFLTQRKLCHQ